MPLLTTPPYPSYAGNMACIGAGTARALALLFGTTTSRSGQWTRINGNQRCGALVRRLLGDCVAQAASREYGGIHYHFDTTASQDVCPKVAGYIFGNFHATEAIKDASP